MSESGFQQFKTIDDDVKTKKITPQEGEEALKSIDFLTFSAQEMETFSGADWISDDVAVSIMKSWKDESDKTLLELRGNALLTSIFDVPKLNGFIEATLNPSKKPNLIIENILNNMATASGTRDFVNPLTGHLISCSNHDNVLKEETFYLFDGNTDTTFTAKPSKDEFLLIRFPPFLRVKLTAYTIGAPKKTAGGIKSWTIYGTNDEINYTPLHQVTDDKHLLAPKPGVVAVHKYVIPNPVDEFFNAFKIVTETNHTNNMSFIASTLDFDGIVTIHPYKALE